MRLPTGREFALGRIYYLRVDVRVRGGWGEEGGDDGYEEEERDKECLSYTALIANTTLTANSGDGCRFLFTKSAFYGIMRGFN